MPNLPAAKEAAQAFVRSYADAMELSLDPNTPLETCATALSSHYAPNFVAFTKGYVISTGEDPDFWHKGVLTHLKRFQKAGLGWKIHLKASRVEALSDTAAACFITWEIEPAKGEGWCWENIYGWRGGQGEGAKGGWEYTVSDNEFDELIKRYPKFMELEV